MTANWRDPRLPERFWNKLTIGSNGCWLWSGQHVPLGYGQIGFFVNKKTKNVYVHRLTYETFVGPIPDKYQLDHLCRVPNCCNPQHLEPVTVSENQRRGIRGAMHRAMASTRTHCKYGHAWSEHAKVVQRLRMDRSGAVYDARVCTACSKERRSRERKAAGK